jgi:hypothetical protein
MAAVLALDFPAGAPTLPPESRHAGDLSYATRAHCAISRTPADAARHSRLAVTLARALQRPGLQELALFTVEGRPAHEHLVLIRDAHGWCALDGRAHLIFRDDERGPQG